jgi:plastocyanin
MSGAQHTEQSCGLMLSLPPSIPAASRRRRPYRLTVLALAVATALPVAGCADDTPPTRVRDGRATVTLDDFSITPQRLRAGPRRVTIRAVNRGAIGHTLRVKRGDREVIVIKTVLPGASGTGSGTLERGDYKLVCILGNHEVLGMYGTLTVR